MLKALVLHSLALLTRPPFATQILPFCSDETLDQLEANLMAMPSMTQMLNAGLGPQEVTDRILAGLGSSSTADAVVPRCVACVRVHTGCGQLGALWTAGAGRVS